ncbi:hypothetical protein DKX38_006947 [Salix brachista]|uniref:Uncharacterized protein n=1 Tax=Salix brachista TaxID=2182728 RepID=A0A5N5MM71_9ROSI|nr:hypothetical protein DKX38_006947 [Salix brachista]
MGSGILSGLQPSTCTLSLISVELEGPIAATLFSTCAPPSPEMSCLTAGIMHGCSSSSIFSRAVAGPRTVSSNTDPSLVMPSSLAIAADEKVFISGYLQSDLQRSSPNILIAEILANRNTNRILLVAICPLNMSGTGNVRLKPWDTSPALSRNMEEPRSLMSFAGALSVNNVTITAIDAR